MKSTFLSLLVIAGIALCTSSVEAQQLGIRGGINVASWAGYEINGTSVEEGDITLGSRILPVAGIYLEFPLVQDLTIQPELTYIGKGFKFDARSLSATDTLSLDSKWTYNHLAIGALAKYRFGGEGFRAYIGAGPQVGFVIGTAEEIDQSGSVLGTSIDTMYTNKNEFRDPASGLDDSASKIELGVVAAIGANIPLGGVLATIDLRYDYGITKTLRVSNDGITGDDRAYNRGIQITAGLQFNIGR